MSPRKPPAWKTVTRIGILLGIVLLVGAEVIREVQAEAFAEGHTLSLILFVLGAAVTLGCLAANYDMLLKLLRQRRTAAGANAVLLGALAVALTALVCYISTRRYTRVDMTGMRRYTLHSKTERMLRTLDRPVRVTVVYWAPSQAELTMDPQAALLRWGHRQAMEMLEEFKAYSSRISVEQLGLGQEHAQVREELNERVGIPGRCVIFESGERHDVIPLIEIAQSPRWQGGSPKFAGEAAFAGALAKITEDKGQIVYFLSGHGERPIEGQPAAPGAPRTSDILTEKYSLSKLVKKLKGDNFESRTLNLADRAQVPEDCDVLVVPGPRTSLPPEHLEAIRRYLEDRDGRVLVMLDSRLHDSASGSNLDALLGEYGIEAHLEALGMFQSSQFALTARGLMQVQVAQSSVPVIEDGYADHPITRDLQNYTLELVRCAPLEIVPPRAKPNLSARKLLTGIGSSWGETTAIEEMEKSEYDPEKDVAGPVVAAVVVEPAPPEGMPPMMAPGDMRGPRLVVLGSSLSFVNTVVAQNEANLYLLLNAVNWLAGKGHMVGIPAKEMDIHVVTLSSGQIRLSRWIFIGAVPACIVVLGIAVWQIRRR